MKTKRDGGPAFPVLAYEYKATGDLHPSPTMQPGMTLRDWFAGMALQGMVAAAVHRKPQLSMQDFEKHAPSACYAYADAMLAQRAKP